MIKLVHNNPILKWETGLIILPCHWKVNNHTYIVAHEARWGWVVVPDATHNYLHIQPGTEFMLYPSSFFWWSYSSSNSSSFFSVSISSPSLSSPQRTTITTHSPPPLRTNITSTPAPPQAPPPALLPPPSQVFLPSLFEGNFAPSFIPPHFTTE